MSERIRMSERRRMSEEECQKKKNVRKKKIASVTDLEDGPFSVCQYDLYLSKLKFKFQLIIVRRSIRRPVQISLFHLRLLPVSPVV
jgi:hypothetical protein